MPAAVLPVFLVFIAFGHCAKDKPELSDEIKEIIQHIHSECVGKTGVTEEDITNCENGIFKEDTKLKCYMYCLLEETSLIDDDGNIDFGMMVSLIPEQYSDRVSNMILPCKHMDTPDKDKCQRVFDVHKCSYQNDPDYSSTCGRLNNLKVGRHKPMTINHFMTMALYCHYNYQSS